MLSVVLSISLSRPVQTVLFPKLKKNLPSKAELEKKKKVAIIKSVPFIMNILNPPAAPHQVEHDSDQEGEQRGYIRATDYSLPYTSQWSRLHHDDCDLLRQLNCNFLSTPEVPPTLLSLKQHAQALCVLLLKLVPSLSASEVDAVNSDEPLASKAAKNDAFDWLADLRTPYFNNDPDHQKPLNTLINEVCGHSDAHGTEYHCPLAETKPPRGKGDAVRPFANHHGLIMHANACLERLDHEFSSEGGLIGLLPTDDTSDTQEKQDARNCLLGQWLVFTQHLVGRMHELELAYGNALDALSGEAVVPLQHLSAAGPDGRSTGRPVAYPQDRWLLVNAGDDVFEHVHNLLDQQEALAEEKERVWRRNGVSGERLWVGEPDGDAHARGLVPINLTTRYYRLAGQGPRSRSTLFLLPAWDHHPAVEHTRNLETNPTVVSALQPKFPQRATELERRYERRIARTAELERSNLGFRVNAAGSLAQLTSLRADLDRERAANRALEASVGRDGRTLAADVARLKAELEGAKADIARYEEGKQVRLADVQSLQERLAQREETLVQRDRDIASLKAQLGKAEKMAE